VAREPVEGEAPLAAEAGVSADRAHAPAALAAPRACAAAVAECAAEDGGDSATNEIRRNAMRTISVRRISDFRKLAAVGAFGALAAAVPALAQQPANQPSPAPPASSSLGSALQAAHGKVFDTPQQAANALIDAAAKFDETALVEIFGPDGQDVVFTGELPQDRQRASDFAAEAHEKTSVSMESKSGNRAFILVGNEQWPFPVPIVKSGDRWYFDSKAGKQELLYRRIGANELSAIDICKGFVEAQDDFAFRKRKEYDVNQYAQNIIAPSGTKDGLAWQESDGSWSGPIGEKIAHAIQQGYNMNGEPYHGYYFKVLKGQGPAAPMGAMNFVVKGIMIGGFALVAAPAEYRVTGVKTFIVSNDGVVYERDFGPATLDEFKKMELFNPDGSWTPTQVR
jgi:hypothetical protein